MLGNVVMTDCPAEGPESGSLATQPTELPSDMLAAYVTAVGSAESIRVDRLPVPNATRGTVLVRVIAAAVNHVDTFVRSGAYRTALTFPFVIGRDLVGVVVAMGEGVTNFVPGQRVWCNSLGFDGRQGACSEYAVVPGERLYPLPPDVTPADAVSLFHPAATAHIGLRREAKLRRGEVVVVNGCYGAVGSAVVQLAAADGARVIGIDRAENAERGRRCGAEVVIDRAAGDVTEQLAAAIPTGIEVFWDTSGRVDLEVILPLMAIGGRVVLVAGMTSQTTLPIGVLYTRDVSVHGFAISNATEADLADAARSINKLLRTGQLRAHDVVAMPLSSAARAHNSQERRDFPGSRFVLTM